MYFINIDTISLVPGGGDSEGKKESLVQTDRKLAHCALQVFF